MGKKTTTRTKINWKFSSKAIESIRDSTGFINIWEGAVRSSKTIASLIRWIEFVRNSSFGEFLITGKTESTVYRNLVGGTMGLINIMDEGMCEFKRSGDGGSRLIMRFVIDGDIIEKTCWVVGANDEGAETKIRGMTVGGWLGDEITLHPEGFVKQALNRLSVEGAKAFWTTNPDSPYHFIKTEYMDKTETRNYKVFHFTLFDNPALPSEYLANITNAYSGLWYKRMIEGLWVMADGVIYDNFRHEQVQAGGHVVAQLPDGVTPTTYYVGIDYGQTNATVFLLVTIGSDGNLYLIDSYYHSGAEGMAVSKSPSDYAKDFDDWLRVYDRLHGTSVSKNINQIIIDPSAKGFILELYKNSKFKSRIRQANNDVLLGINNLSSIIARNRLYVVAQNKDVLKELSTYSWDAKAQLKGIDKPMKVNDHAMDALRYLGMALRLKLA
jgi:PBSX family phage terminase large subunit